MLEDAEQQRKNEEIDALNAKSFKVIYIIVALIYVAEIVAYSVVTH